MSSTDVKRGATFSRSGLFKLPVGTWTADSDLNRTSGGRVQTLTCLLAPLATPDANGNTHALTISATAAQTLLWPLVELSSDIRFKDASGVVMFTTTYTVNVLKNETVE